MLEESAIMNNEQCIGVRSVFKSTNNNNNEVEIPDC